MQNYIKIIQRTFKELTGSTGFPFPFVDTRAVEVIGKINTQTTILTWLLVTFTNRKFAVLASEVCLTYTIIAIFPLNTCT